MAENGKSGGEAPGGERAGDLWRLLNDPGRMIDDELNVAEDAPQTDREQAAEKPAERPKYFDEPRPDGYDDLDLEALEPRRRQVVLPDPVEVPADFDPAVHEFVNEETLAVQCKNHPQTDAVAVCPNCEAYFCQPCLVIHRGRLVCRECRDTLNIRSEEEILSEAESGEAAAHEFGEKEKPEFQVSGAFFGIEGRPASPLKRLIAHLIDFIVVRGTVLIILLVLDKFMSGVNNPIFHLFEPGDGFETPGGRIFNALVLMYPLIPWVFVWLVTDFIYYFLSLGFANRTLGMSWTGCRIVTEWGDFVPFGQVALRVLVFLGLLEWPAILLAWFFPNFRGPHDLAAGTVVINYDGVTRIDAYETVQIRL
jgi:uncharacterized RDD family membrane protein YckC